MTQDQYNLEYEKLNDDYNVRRHQKSEEYAERWFEAQVDKLDKNFMEGK